MGDSWNLPLVLNGGSQATATPTSSTPTPSAVATMTVTPTASDPGQVVLSSVADTMISSNHASQNFGSTIDMWVGFDDNAESLAGIVRSLVRFDLASVPAGATVTSATLRLYHKSSWDYPDRSRPARAYRAQDAWNELSSTWDNQPAFSDGYGSVAIVHGDYGWVEMSVTDLVQAWLDGSHANHGIVVRGDENTSADSGHRDFYTREADGTTYAPQLVVVYQ